MMEKGLMERGYGGEGVDREEEIMERGKRWREVDDGER